MGSGASLAMDLSHSRPHRVFRTAPVKPFTKFSAAVERVVANCLGSKGRSRGPASDLREGDARALSHADGSMDLVLTSPPYLNAIDYMRCSKFSLVWMGYSLPALRALRSGSVGSEAVSGSEETELSRTILDRVRLRPALTGRERRILLKYIDDMAASVRETARVLAPGGQAVYVIGENTLRGTYIRNSSILTILAQTYGLVLLRRRVRHLPANRRYLPPPARTAAPALDGRMRREVILSFRK